MATKLNCPTCDKAITWSEDYPERPFCSERCKLIDLGEWAAENHRIPGSPVYDELLSGDLPDQDGSSNLH